MARLPRFFVPDQPLHIIQRGNNREPIFASDDDYRFYLECLKDAADMGYNGTVAMGINLPFIPVGLRIDGAYNQFGEKAGIPAKLHVVSATGNVVWRLPSIGISPYLIGGGGLYMQSVTPTGGSATNDNHLGWNAGAGVSLPLTVFKAFVEARYNSYKTDTGNVSFVPLTFGIMF